MCANTDGFYDLFFYSCTFFDHPCAFFQNDLVLIYWNVPTYPPPSNLMTSYLFSLFGVVCTHIYDRNTNPSFAALQND